MHVCICHTEGCSNAETPIDMQLTYLDETGTEQTVDSVTCGVCDQPITDIEPPLG
jgi:hypothetical protein